MSPVWVAPPFTRAYTRTQARGATPELRHVTDTTSHGLSAGSAIGIERCAMPHDRYSVCGVINPPLQYYTYISSSILTCASEAANCSNCWQLAQLSRSH